MSKERGRKLVAQNRKARHDFHVEDTYEAGLVLTGTEVKSLRAGRASLVDGFAEVRDDEVWLQGVHIPPYTQGTWTNHEPRRARRQGGVDRGHRGAGPGLVLDHHRLAERLAHLQTDAASHSIVQAAWRIGH